MAVATTSYISSTCPRVTLTVSESSSTGSSITYAYTLKYVTNGYTMETSQTKTVTASIGGTSVYNAPITVGYKTTYTIKTGTITLNKTHSSQSISINVSIAWGGASWSGTTLGTRSGSASMTLAAKTSYSIVYNANGGSGAPSKQTKWYGETLTLSSTKPSRTGYAFSKWNTASGGGGTNYSSGASYTANAGATLYAIWTANKYTITLNANGGSGGTTSITKTYNASVTLPSSANSPKRTNYKFLGWATTKSAKSAQWTAGSTYSNNITSNITLYAVWELSYIAPKITNFSVYRSDSSGNKSDDGTYAKVSFNWIIDTSIYTSNEMKSVDVTFNGTSKYSSTDGGTSGTVSQIISDISTETSYTIVAKVADTYENGSTTTKTGTVESAKYVIDISPGGTGIGIRTIAPSTGVKIGADVTVTDKIISTYDDCGFRQTHGTSGVTASFGVGSGGKNHGVYSTTLGKWIIRCNSDNGKTYVNNYEYGENHVLWSGGYYMIASQTATLSEAVSDQPHGIILVFREYSSEDGMSKNSGIYTYFVPKQTVADGPGWGHSISWAHHNGSYFITKYVYINNTQIVGNEINGVADVARSPSGITVSPKKAVLWKVIGV